MGPFLTERRKDRLATVLIRTGGLLVILVVVGIVINIGSEAVPLFQRAAQGPVEVVAEERRTDCWRAATRGAMWCGSSIVTARSDFRECPPSRI